MRSLRFLRFEMHGRNPFPICEPLSGIEVVENDALCGYCDGLSRMRTYPILLIDGMVNNCWNTENREAPMDHVKLPAVEPAPRTAFEQVQTTMHGMVLRQWWLSSSAFLVMLILTVGIASFAFPGLLAEQKEFYALNLNLAVRGLVGLVLLFNIYSIYQQWQIHRIQQELQKQIGAFGRLEDRTEQVYKIAALDCLTGLYNRQSGSSVLPRRFRDHSGMQDP